MLSSLRKRKDTLSDSEWTALAKLHNGRQRADWLLARKMPWNKKTGITLTSTFPSLLSACAKANVVAVGSKDLPFCLVSPDERKAFAAQLATIYGSRVDAAFLEWLSDSQKPLAIVWIAGFKPRGDDSRPDRGLVPFIHMVFGNDSVDYLTVVYGPAKQQTWTLFESDLDQLSKVNGLWEAIIQLSDGILVDSPTSNTLESIGVVVKRKARALGNKRTWRVPAVDVPKFGEHDVDTVLHVLFANVPELGVFEGMCNPPGGDWSGISIQTALEGEIFRWTSLPRVSGEGSKRPDHVIVFHQNLLHVLAIESKNTSGSVEPNIGPRLCTYITDLMLSTPNTVRALDSRIWVPHTGGPITAELKVISAAAFQYQKETELQTVLSKGVVDIAIGVEFLEREQRVLVHLLCKPEVAWFSTKMDEMSKRFEGRIEIKKH